MSTGDAYIEITAVLEDYFDGFHACDIEKLKTKVFHPICHLHTAQEGRLVDDDMDAVYARLGARVSPEAQGQERVREILSIDVTGPVTAMAKVRIGLAPRLYTDYLVFLKVDGRWRINAKTYCWVPLEDASQLNVAAE